MRQRPTATTPRSTRAHVVALGVGLSLLVACNQPQTSPGAQVGDAGLEAQGLGGPKYSSPVAFDTSPPLRSLVKSGPQRPLPPAEDGVIDLRPERGTRQIDRPAAPDGALQKTMSGLSMQALGTVSAPLVSFEGPSSRDNVNLYGGTVNPPDPVGDVGPNHYVAMTNLAYAVYDKQGNALVGPAKIGDLWANFAVPDCADPSGDPIVMYDQLADRWILTQFTTRGLNNPSLPFYNCVAVSTTGDPTGTYYRYAFTTGLFFPDYPKYGVWTDSYIVTTREFGPTVEYGIGVYALEKNKMIVGDPKARAVRFFLDSDVVPLAKIGDGLLPPDIDGTRRPLARVAAPLVGTQDDGAFYGAGMDALNVYDLSVQWNSKPLASLTPAAQLPVDAFDSIFPCGPDSRDCLPQPGITNRAQYLDVLSYRQRPQHRLAYRNFGTYEALVTNQTVEARPGQAGLRWYELRRTAAGYSVHQQGTYAPDDGIQRWMGSAAMDRSGNLALGYSVVNGTDVFPGIRYTGRLGSDALNTMTLGEGTLVNGSGVQRTTNSRWGDYTSLNVDPLDDCTFWYINEYYTAAGAAASLAGWQTRIGSFRTPGCTP